MALFRQLFQCGTLCDDYCMHGTKVQAWLTNLIAELKPAHVEHRPMRRHNNICTALLNHCAVGLYITSSFDEKIRYGELS